MVTDSALEVIDLGIPDSLSILVQMYQQELIPDQKLAIRRGDPDQQDDLNKQFFTLSSTLYEKTLVTAGLNGPLKGQKGHPNPGRLF